MRQYKDNELNRLLSETEELLAGIDLTLYETPAEEKARKEKEEALRIEDELKQKEDELRRLQEEERKMQEELARKELEQEELTRKEAEREELARKEAECEELARKEAERDELARKEAEREALARKEAEREFLAQREAEKELAQKKAEQEALARKEVEREVVRKEAEQKAIAQKGAEQEKTVIITAEEHNETAKASCEVAGVIFIILSFMYMEALTHIGVYHAISTDFIFPLFFAAAVGCLVRMLSAFMGKTGNMIVVLVCEMVYAVYCNLQMVSHAATGNFIRLAHIGGDMRALTASGQITEGLAKTLIWGVLMFLPIIFWAVIGRRWMSFSKYHILTQIVIALGMAIFAVIGIVLLDVKGYGEASPYRVFYGYESDSSAEQAGNQLGMTALAVLDIVDSVGD